MELFMNQCSAGDGKKGELFERVLQGGALWTGRGGLVYDKSESFWASIVGGRIDLSLPSFSTVFPATLCFGTFSRLSRMGWR
jgi:hypothetical protein